jgi:predicted nucleotidyltransferase
MSENRGGVDSLILGRSAIRRRILELFVIDPDARRHLREIARLAGTSSGTASRELGRLLVAGLIERSVEGRQVYFQAIPSPLFRSVSAVVRQTGGARAVLRKALEDVPAVDRAVIFGSYAAGVTRPSSDIDLLVVGSPDRDLLTERLELAAREIGRPVNEVVFTAAELASRRDVGDPFADSIDAGQTIQVLP